MKFADRIKETTTTTGTGSVTLTAIGDGFLSFQDVFAVGDQVPYCIFDNAINEWEIGLGTLTSLDVLERTQVYANFNGDLSLISLGSGSKDVFCTIPAYFVNQLTTRGLSIALASGIVL